MSFDQRVALLALSSLIGLRCGGSAPTAAEPRASQPAVAAQAKPGEPAKAGARKELDATGFLSSIPTRVSDRAKALVAESANDEDFARALRVRLELMHAYKDAGELSRRSKLPLVNGTFQLSDLSRLGSHEPPKKGDLRSSFVIDYEEQSVRGPAEELQKTGNASTPAGISSFVGNYINEKSYARSFDVASRVATTRSGDCTEHAVLTTALLRRFGFEARVVLGVVLFGVTGGDLAPSVKAFGHAWVEHYEQGSWQIVDAALGGPECATASQHPTVCGLPPGTTRRLAYLPINVMKDETASFNRALMDQVGIESIVRVEVDVATKS